RPDRRGRYVGGFTGAPREPWRPHPCTPDETAGLTLPPLPTTGAPEPLRVAADGRPDRAQRLQTSLRGLDGEATRCSRSKSNGFPARPGYPPTGPALFSARRRRGARLFAYKPSSLSERPSPSCSA